MRLSVAGIPPLASHTAALLVGFALAHLEAGQSISGAFGGSFAKREDGGGGCFRSLAPRTILAALPKDTEPPRGLDLGKPPLVFAVRATAGGACRLVETGLRLYARSPQPVVATTWDGERADDFLTLVRAARAGEVKLTAKAAAEVLPLCHRGAQVTYGPPT